MKKVGMYRKKIPLVSETFIADQANHLSRYHPVFLTCSKISEVPHETLAINDNDFMFVKQGLHLLTRSAKTFGSKLIKANLDLIHGHFGTDGIYAMTIAQELSIPFVVSFYGYEVSLSKETVWKAKSPFFAFQFLMCEKALQKNASAFLVNSCHMRDKLIEKGYPKEKILQHYLGTDLSKLSPAKQPSSERYILCVARHTEKKGIDTLLRAFAQIASKFPDVSLVQVGSGHLTPMLTELTSALNIVDRVRFLGSQPYDKVQELTRGAEIFALPSQTAPNGDTEGLPCVLVEASACGIPIVSTWHSGIPEAVLDNKTGFLVEEKDDRTLAKKLDVLLSDQSLGKTMGEMGREHVCEHFDLKKQVARLETIYDQVIS